MSLLRRVLSDHGFLCLSIIIIVIFDFRLPIEVHRDKCYTKKSDVYMLSMVMYEVFEAVYFNKEDPLRNPILCVPFYDIPRDDVNKSFYLLMQCL